MRAGRWGDVRADCGWGVGAAHNGPMSAAKDCRISRRGRLTVPADLRRRCGLVDGGVVGFIDLGEAALVVPGDVASARAELRLVLDDRYEVGLAVIDDADVAEQRPSRAEHGRTVGHGQDDDGEPGPSGSFGDS